MRQDSSFQAHERHAATSCLAVLLALALLGACASAADEVDVAELEALGRHDDALIGGGLASADHFRSTVGIGNVCTAAKVGPRLFLTAGHCVEVARPSRIDPVPPDFPPNDGVASKYLPGAPLQVHWGLEASDGEQGVFTIVKTTIHPSWWECPLCDRPILFNGAADIALIEIAEDTPFIPEARVDLAPVELGTELVKVGWGCEVRTNIDAASVQLGRYKREDSVAISASEIVHETSPITEEMAAEIAAQYVVTAGRSQSEAFASLCLGDSGGPLYLPDNGDPRVVGVNSDYSFRDESGVSWTDWHTRTSRGSLHDVAGWLIDLGVNTVED